MVLELQGLELDTVMHTELRRSRVLEFLQDRNGCFVPDDDSKHPWFVDWLPAQWTYKHLHTLRRRPQLDTIRSDLNSFINKIRWRSILQSCDGGDVVRIKRPVVACKELVEPEVVAWCANLRNVLLRAVNVGLSTGSTYNTSRLYMWALKQMRASEWTFMRNDEEGGWSIMPKIVMRGLA